MPGEMPRLGLGTYQQTDRETCVESVRRALEAGYRHVDTAQSYGNEALVAEGLARADRDADDVFVATKLDPEHLAYDDVIETLGETSTFELVALRRVAVTAVLIVLISIASIQVAVVDPDLGGLFGPDGAPDFDESSPYPRDIHASTQGILVFTYAGEFDRARRLVRWVLDNL